ncbi:MAG: hypothetical protein LC737_11520, partial [Chloroflexi bacterium]|nr:hypothetical protein [Chloroflexota bacterium]
IRVSDETVRKILHRGGIVLSRPKHKVSSPDLDYEVKKRRLQTRATTAKRVICSTMPMSSISVGCRAYEPYGAQSVNKS